MARRSGYIQVTVRFATEGKQWAAECLELGTAACGDSLEEAKDAITDLIVLHLNALEDVGTCAKFLKEHGVVIHRHRPKPARTKVPVRTGEFVTRLTEEIPLVATM